MFNPFRKGINKGAFQGELNCPYCSKHVDPTTTPLGFETDKPKIRLVERIGPFMMVYRCGYCNGRFRYDINKRQLHPYSSCKRGLKMRGVAGKPFAFHGNVPIIGT